MPYEYILSLAVYLSIFLNIIIKTHFLPVFFQRSRIFLFLSKSIFFCCSESEELATPSTPGNFFRVATSSFLGGHPCRTSTSTRLKALAAAARPRLGQSDLFEAGYPLAGGQVRRLNGGESCKGKEAQRSVEGKGLTAKPQ